MKKIGKDKAPSYDGMTDILFKRRKYKGITIRGYKPDREEEPIKIQDHIDQVERILASRL